ncbi:MAG: hypothetical protein Q8P13_00370 [bacterium]|nr:hypothetical protein [bacterium]
MATYWERLDQITGGRVPEEGDYNTARLTASDTPPSVRRAIIAELQSIEHGVSDDDVFDEMYPVEDDDRDAFHIAAGKIHTGDERDCYECNPLDY